MGLLRASGGRAVVLFSSYALLRAVAERLRSKLPYTLLVQDQGSTTQILQQFKEDVHSVLLATSRFWEGIDIAGEALSLLVIAACRLTSRRIRWPMPGSKPRGHAGRTRSPRSSCPMRSSGSDRAWGG